MSKRILQHKKKALTDIKSASEIGGLAAAFLGAFGYQLEVKKQKIKQLKANLVNAKTPIDRYQAWRRINDMYHYLLERSPADISALKEQGFDLDSLTKAYLKPDNLGLVQRELWDSEGSRFVDDALSPELHKAIEEIDSQIQSILRTDADVDISIKKIEKTYISPLMKKARATIDKIAAGDKNPAHSSQIDEIKNEIESIYKDKIDPIITAAQSSDKISADDKVKLINLKKEKREIGAHMMSGVYDALIEKSTITHAEAEFWASNQEITTSAASRLRKTGYPPTEVKRDLAAYYQIMNGRIDNVRIVTTGSNRASAVINTATIDIDGNFNREVLYHELSHLLEADELVKEVNQSFIRNRATGEPEQLSVLTNNWRYGADEIALPDHFFSPYVGKLYSEGATEVSAMGIQQFSSPEKMFQLYEADPEMFKLMVGMMTTMTKDQLVRRKDELRKKLNDTEFYKKLDKHVHTLKFIKGHTLTSDEEYERYQDASKVGKKNFNYVKKWCWEEVLGDCELRPAKAKGNRKQFYVVEIKGDKRHFFKEKLLAQAFCYLYELSDDKDAQLIFTITSKKLCPDWYQGGDLPPL